MSGASATSREEDRISDDELRRTNEALVRRFVAAASDSKERDELWAADAVFEPALDPSGTVFRGKDAIMQRGRDSAARIRDFRVSELVIHPLLDPNVFLLTHVGEAVSRASGKPLRSRFASILTLRDGKVVHRIEFSAFTDPAKL